MGVDLKRYALVVLAVTLSGCALIEQWVLKGGYSPDPQPSPRADCRTTGCPEGLECAVVPGSAWGHGPDDKLYACRPKPSPTPDPVPTHHPSPVPPSPAPSTSPLPADCRTAGCPDGQSCVPVNMRDWKPIPLEYVCVPGFPPSPCPSPKPQCMRIGDNGPEPAQDCVPCARYIREGLAAGELHPEGDVVYNIGDKGKEYIHPKTCDIIYGPNDQRTRARRLQKGGYVCDPPGCSKEPPVPCVSPKPPSPPSSPVPPPPNAPPLTESGNLPMDYLAAMCRAGRISPTHEVGISVLSQRACAGEPDCIVTNLHATEKSVKPYCEHSCLDEQGRYALANCRNTCETLRECQQPEFVNGNTGIVMEIKHPDWNNEWGACDKRTAECDLPDCRRNFICHDRATRRVGKTRARACMPDGSRCGPERSF